jgi:uncharacterized membrane protein
MKVKFLSLIVSLFAVTASLAQTNTNSVASTNAPTVADVANAAKDAVSNTVQQVSQASVNSVLIEMLSGVKTAGGEIYTASKEMIHNGVNFVSEQAPDVVKQFLTWKFWESGAWMIMWFVVIGLLLYLRYRASQFSVAHKETDDLNTNFPIGWIMKWVSYIIIGFVLVFPIRGHALNMVKIGVAPKVYIIEYVVDLVKDASGGPVCKHCGQRH